jgi:hypothetical protein
MPDKREVQPLTFSAEERERDEFSRSWHVVSSDGNDIIECGSEDHARWIARALTILERAHEPSTAMIEAGDAASPEEYGSLATSFPIGGERNLEGDGRRRDHRKIRGLTRLPGSPHKYGEESATTRLGRGTKPPKIQFGTRLRAWLNKPPQVPAEPATPPCSRFCFPLGRTHRASGGTYSAGSSRAISRA